VKSRNLALVFAVILTVSCVAAQASAAKLTPKNPEVMTGMPTPFVASGLVAGASYDILVDSVHEYDAEVATTEGELAFSVTVDESGSFTVAVVNATTHVVIVSTTLHATDILEILMPVIVLFVSVTIVLGVVAELKFGKN